MYKVEMTKLFEIEYCHGRSDCLQKIMISPAICKLTMSVHSITKTSNGQGERG